MTDPSCTATRAIRIERGESLPAAADRVVEDLGLEFCDVIGFGRLDWVELKGDSQGPPTRMQGPYDLLDLKGRVRRVGSVIISEYVCTISGITDGEIRVFGGGLERAVVDFAELTIIPLVLAKDATAAKDVVANDAYTKPDASTPSAPSPVKDDAEKWSVALAESRRLERVGAAAKWDEVEPVMPVCGDIVNHRQFGRCDVVRVDSEHISLRKPDRRVVQLGLTILVFESAGEHDGKAVYNVSVTRS
jgi:predicted DNA-binding protein with PD1-like motif